MVFGTTYFTAFFVLCFFPTTMTLRITTIDPFSNHSPRQQEKASTTSIPDEDFLQKEELLSLPSPESKLDDVTSEGSGGWLIEVKATAESPSNDKLSRVDLTKDLRFRNISAGRNKSKSSPRKKQGLKKSPRGPSHITNTSPPNQDLAVLQTESTDRFTKPNLELTSVPIHDHHPFWTQGTSFYDKDIPPVGKNSEPDPFFKLYPVWSEAKLEWGSAWQVHLFTAGPLFILLALYSLASLLRIRFVAHLLGRSHFVFLNAFQLLLGASRSAYLLDGYNCQGRFPTPIAYFLQDIGSPCLSSSFAILFLALLKAAHVQIFSSRSQGSGFVSAAVAFHFSLTLTSDLIASLVDNAEPLLLACQTAYGLWCFVLSAAYFGIFRSLHKAAIRKQCEMIRLTFTKLHIDGATLPRKLPRPTLALTVRVTLVTAVLVMALAVHQIYGVIFVYGLSTTRKPDPWPWWCYQYANRCIELVICGCIALAANQTIRQYEGESGLCSRFIPCRCVTPACFCQEDTDLYDSFLESNHNGNRHPLGKTGTKKGNSLPLFHPLPSSDPEVNIHGLPLQSGDCENVLDLGNGIGYHYKRSSRRTLSDGMSTTANAASWVKGDIRHSSMLYMDHGFIRFRSEDDPEQPMELSDANSETETHGSPSKWSSIHAEAGSSGIRSLCEDDFVQSSLSPFFKQGYRHQQLFPKFRRFSRCSLDTLDNTSGDIASDVLPARARPNSDSQMLPRKCGSTCSSESAANSFDVTFFLQQRKLEASPQTRTVKKDNPYCYVPFQKGISSSVLRSVSPLVGNTAATSKRFQVIPLNLDLSKEGLLGCGFTSVACGTEDVTPDSAVYMDLNGENETCRNPASSSDQDSHSHSLSDLSGWKAGSLRCKRSLTFLNKLKGSSFSLNQGYEPLNRGEEEVSKAVTYRARRRDVRPSRPRAFISLSDFGPEERFLAQVDSGLVGDCRDRQCILVDTASQTEAPFEMTTLIGSRQNGKIVHIVPKASVLQNS